MAIKQTAVFNWADARRKLTDRLIPKRNLEREELQRTRGFLELAISALELCQKQAGLDDPNWKNLSALAFAARCGLVDQTAKQALEKIRESRGGK